MTLSIDVPLFAIRHQQIGGTEFAIYNLVKGLAAAPARTTLYYYDCKQHLSPEFLAWLEQTPDIGQKIGQKIAGPKNVRFLQETLFEWGYRASEWVLYPNYFIPPRPPWSSRSSAVILHDVQYKVLPEYHSASRRAWLDRYLPWMFERADRVLLISQSEKRHVGEFFGNKAADKCDVIYNAVDWDRFAPPAETTPAGRIDELTSRPFLLTVCHQFPHKNLPTLLHAFEQISRKYPDMLLYMVGMDSPSNREFVATQLSSVVRGRVRLLGFLSDSDLGALYRAAQLFVLPSLYEGFGMPAVEALGLGTPILVSGTTSLPEVTMGFGTYVEQPRDVDAWVSQIDDQLRSGDRPMPQKTDILRARYSPAAVARSLLSAL